MTEPSMQLLSSTFLEDAGSWLVPSTAVGASLQCLSPQKPPSGGHP